MKRVATVASRKRSFFLQLAYAFLLTATTLVSAWLARDTIYGGRTPMHVWWYGWVTAISTGLGALPLLGWKEVSSRWLGLGNAVAAGMMTAASAALVAEGFAVKTVDVGGFAPGQSVLLGAAVGVLFIMLGRQVLGAYDNVQLDILEGVDVRKALLIVLVMTLHSFSEGIGIGVSFGSNSPPKLGLLITTTLAVHNIPEGFAISVVLVSRGMSVFGAVLWSITTSLPQPLMALVAFMAIDIFVCVQRAGLGFAAGAMLWVAWAELFPEAFEACGLLSTASVGIASAYAMWMCHEYMGS